MEDFDDENDDIYGEIAFPNNFLFNNNQQYEINNCNIINGFKELINRKISIKSNPLYTKIENETFKINKYFLDKINNFPIIFEKNFSSLEKVYEYLEKISIPNKCECAGIIDNIPGWRCVDCSKYENSIYCSNCYINSKQEHKDHRVEFLYSSGGMCDCGDPDSLYKFCPNHCGPYTNQKQIDEYIEKTFPKNILTNLKLFFDDLFMEFSKYLLLTEKCKYFYTEILEDNITKDKEKDDILLLKNNFAIVFQNLINFLYKITEKNLGMLHLIASYFLKNNLPHENIDEQSLTTHSCIKLGNDDIQILYKNKNENESIFSTFSFSGQNKHKCECPFLRLLFSNWRDNVESYDKNDNQNEKFLLSFSHNLFLRESSAVIIFFLYKEIILNNNKDDILYTRNQFFIEDTIELVAKKTILIEEGYEYLYSFINQALSSSKSKDLFDTYRPNVIEKILDKIKIYMYDSKYFTKPKIRPLMYSKTSMLKRLIDIGCLMHNLMEFKSIYPHPAFQEKKCVVELINAELFFIYNINIIFLYTPWENMDKVKEIFNYFIDRIFYLNKTKKLQKNEFSFHLLIYRQFSSFINFFCINYALNNKCDINTAIDKIKNTLFKSKKEMESIINIILNDYFKMFGFIIGIRNEYFNYYELENYNFIYFNDLRELKQDYTLLKYLFAMSEQKINLQEILEISNIENSYSFFKRVFDNNQINEKESKKNEENKGFSLFGMLKFGMGNPLNPIKRLFGYGEKDKKDEDENKHIMQWKRVLEIVISIIKNDTTPLFNILTYYDESISLKTKTNLFNSIKGNKTMMEDCRNMIKERLVQVIIANGNLIDLKGIQKGIDKFFSTLFKENELNEILDELTLNKMNGEKKEFYLKDSCLKYLDMNYYYSPISRSKAEIYISDFKKDVFKLYNSYYYKPSELTFDFYHKAYENILLNIDNINFFIKIIKILLNPEIDDNSNNFNIKSIRKILLPVILNLISMFGNINSKSFIQFKIQNENLINEIITILKNAISINKDKTLLDNELIDNIINVIKQLNIYKIINDNINNDLSKLNDKDYNFNFEFKEKKNEDNNINKINTIETINLDTEEEKKKNKIKDIKSHLKSKMKKKSGKFLNKAIKNKNMEYILNAKTSKEDNTNEGEEDEMMCFYCRNSINLKNFDKPYGKLGLIFNDYFFVNSFNSTIFNELNNIIENNEEKNENIISSIINNRRIIKEKTPRITSCGHYFHQSCFNKGELGLEGFKCPLCEKLQNILIPPLIKFYGQDSNLKSIKFDDILKENIINKSEINKGEEIFKNIIIIFLKKIIIIDNNIKYTSFIKVIIIKYQSFINFLINLFYSNGTTFHKQQQIETIQNFILSIRYLVNTNNIHINEITTFINNKIQYLIKGISIDENIIENYENLSYNDIFDKLLFSFLILLDFEELKNVFIYIINWILPYMSFWVYIRNLIKENKFYNINNKNLEEKISIENLKKFLEDNNKQMIDYLYRYLQKFVIIKVLSDYNNKNNNLNYNIKEFSLEQLFSLLNMDNLYQSFSINDNGEIIFTDLLEKLPKILSEENYNKNIIISDYNEIFNSMINNFKKQKSRNALIKAELIAQFIPYEFQLIHLDINIFDWIEKCLFKKCCFCNNYSKYYYICLICGQKICETKICDLVLKHVDKCGGGSGIFVHISNLRLFLIKSSSKKKKNLYPLYVNESGVGPSGYEIENEYKLSLEKYNLALKDYVSNDFH